MVYSLPHLRSSGPLPPLIAQPPPPLIAQPPVPTHTPTQSAKNKILADLSKKFPANRHVWSRGLNRRANECYRLSALQCLLHLPRALTWFLQHHTVRPDDTGNPRVVNPCKNLLGDADSGDLPQGKGDCMACAIKALIPHYWTSGKDKAGNQDRETPPNPLNSDDPLLQQIYRISTTDYRFAPQQVEGYGGNTTAVDPQCDAEEWMSYCLDQCRLATDVSIAPEWEAGYKALFEFEFEERRYCNVCNTFIARGPNDSPASFKQSSIGFNNCPIDRKTPGTVADAINAQMEELPTPGASITRTCPKCGPRQPVTRRFRIESAPEYMFVKFVTVYDAAPPRSPNSKARPVPDLRKITNKNELPQIDEILDLTRCQVNTGAKLKYRLTAVLPHIGEYQYGHWIATVRNHPRWYNINDENVRKVQKKFALSNPEDVPVDFKGTEEEQKKNANEFQVVLLVYARVY